MCSNGSGVFVKVGNKEARMLHDAYAGKHKLSCQGNRCVMAYTDDSLGITILPFSLP